MDFAIDLDMGFIFVALLGILGAALIGGGVQIVDGVRIYEFDTAIQYWIATSVVSMLLAASLWNAKIRD